MGDASGGKAAEGAALFQTGSDAMRPSPREGSHAFGTKLTCGHEAPLAPRSLCPMRLLKDRTLGESREVTGGRSAARSGVTRLTTRWSGRSLSAISCTMYLCCAAQLEVVRCPNRS